MLVSTLLIFNGCGKKVVYVDTPKIHLHTWRVKAPKGVQYEVYEVYEVDEVGTDEVRRVEKGNESIKRVSKG